MVNTLRRRREIAFDAEFTHQAGDLVTADVVPGTAGGLPELVGPVDLAVRDPQRHQDRHPHRVSDAARADGGRDLRA